MRQRADRRRPSAEQLLRGPPESRLFAGIRRPLRRALETLGPRAGRIDAAWRQLVRRLGLSRTEYDALCRMDPAASYRLLSGSGLPAKRSLAVRDDAYRRGVERQGRELLRFGMPEGHAMAAVAFYLEACLAHLEDRSEARALVRATSATQRILAAGYAQERSAGLLQLDARERRRLMGNLHDEVGADLIVLKLYVEMIARDLAQGRVARVGPKLRETLALIGHAVESVRRLTRDLGPEQVEGLGFLPAVRRFVKEFSDRTRVKVRLSEHGAGGRMPLSHENALYRVLRGALSNVAKHSQARKVHVTVGRVGDELVVMTVQDDGKGFDPARQRNDQSFGLTAMRERIRGLGGRLQVDSRTRGPRGARSGTRIEVQLPLKASDAMSRTIRVLICDDHSLFREGLRAILREQPTFEVVGEARNGLEAVESARSLRPDVVLMDIDMPELSGLEATRRIGEAKLPGKVLILSLYDDEDLIAGCLDAGAAGYVLKDGPSSQLLYAIEAVHRGERYLSPRALSRVVEHGAKGGQGTGTRYDLLTSREREVLKLLADGFSSKNIAERLVLSVKTVDAHKYNLMRKLDIHDRAGLVKYAIRKKLVHLPTHENS